MGSPVKDFLAAVQSCGKFDASLAQLKSQKSASKALKIIAALNSTSMSDIDGFWIDARTQNYNFFENLAVENHPNHDGLMKKSCLVLMKVNHF